MEKINYRQLKALYPTYADYEKLVIKPIEKLYNKNKDQAFLNDKDLIITKEGVYDMTMWLYGERYIAFPNKTEFMNYFTLYTNDILLNLYQESVIKFNTIFKDLTDKRNYGEKETIRNKRDSKTSTSTRPQTDDSQYASESGEDLIVRNNDGGTTTRTQSNLLAQANSLVSLELRKSLAILLNSYNELFLNENPRTAEGYEYPKVEEVIEQYLSKKGYSDITKLIEKHFTTIEVDTILIDDTDLADLENLAFEVDPTTPADEKPKENKKRVKKGGTKNG